MPDDDLLTRIQRLEEDNHRLSALVERLSTRDTPVNRRGLLKQAGAVALGATAVTATGQALTAPSAAAADSQPMLLGRLNGSIVPTVYRCDHGGGPAFTATNFADGAQDLGVLGWSVIGVLGRGTHAGVKGDGSSGAHGVFGISDTGIGVAGQGDKNTGIYGSGRYGVRGDGTNIGVAGGSVDGDGVFGSSAGGNGVFGRIYQANSRANAGVYGMALAPVNQPDLITSAGVVGESRDCIGVHGASTTNNGVVGFSESARGGVFSGGAAAVQLKPGMNAGAPTAGQTGDLYVDSTGRLWYCRQGGGTANWITLVG